MLFVNYFYGHICGQAFPRGIISQLHETISDSSFVVGASVGHGQFGASSGQWHTPVSGSLVVDGASVGHGQFGTSSGHWHIAADEKLIAATKITRKTAKILILLKSNWTSNTIITTDVSDNNVDGFYYKYTIFLNYFYIVVGTKTK